MCAKVLTKKAQKKVEVEKKKAVRRAGGGRPNTIDGQVICSVHMSKVMKRALQRYVRAMCIKHNDKNFISESSIMRQAIIKFFADERNITQMDFSDPLLHHTAKRDCFMSFRIDPDHYEHAHAVSKRHQRTFSQLAKVAILTYLNAVGVPIE